MKYLFLFVILCTSAFGSDLVSKAQIIEAILNDSENADIVQAFESTSMIGASIESMRQHGIEPDVEQQYQIALSELIRIEVGTAAIDTFTLQELTILKDLNEGSSAEKSLVLKTLCLATAQKPRVMQKASRIMMDYTKALTRKKTRAAE